MTTSDLLRDASTLTLREKLAQLIFVRIGSNLPPIRAAEEDGERVARLLANCPVGGLLLFNGGPLTRESLDRLQRKSSVPLLVAADIERGVGQQVRGYTLFPHAMAFEQLGSEAAAVVAEFATVLARAGVVPHVHQVHELGLPAQVDVVRARLRARRHQALAVGQVRADGRRHHARVPGQFPQ